MELRDLVDALLEFDAIRARQWVADAARIGIRWSDVPRPIGLTAEGAAVAAGLAELMAQRAGEPPPAWTIDVQASPRRIFLVRAAESMPRLRTLCEREGPEPLRRRGLFAPPDFLSVA